MCVCVWGTSIKLFLWTRLRTIFLLKGGLTARPPCQLHVVSIKRGRGPSIKKTQGNLWQLKEIPSARSRAQRRPFVPRHVSHTFRAQISSSFMKPCFIFVHCNVPVGSGNTGKHCQCRGNIPLPHTHYGVKNKSHRLGGPEVWLQGFFFFAGGHPLAYSTSLKTAKPAVRFSLFLKWDKRV